MGVHTHDEAVVFMRSDCDVCRSEGLEPDKQCILVLIGATPEGRKELIGFHVGYRESAQSWCELLADLKTRGLAVPPELALGTARSVSGKRLNKSLEPRSSSAAGCTKR
jgi:hypothetical protein